MALTPNKRNMSATLEAETEKQAVIFYELVDITVGTGGSEKTYRITNAPHLITYNSNTYSAFGTLLSFDDVEESADLEIPKLQIGISGIQDPDNTDINPAVDFLTLDYTHSPVVITRVYYNDDGYVGAVQLFKGYVTGGSIVVNTIEQCAVSLEVASHWSDFSREAGRYTNDSSQQRYFSGDLGMEYGPEVQKEIQWKA